MRHQQEFQRHLDALACVAGLTGLSAAGRSECVLSVDGRFDVRLVLEDEAACIRIRADLGPVEPSRREELYARMLARNLFAPPPDTVCSLNAGLGVCLSCRISLRELESVALAQVLEAFLTNARQCLDDMQASGEPPPESPLTWTPDLIV